MKNTVKMLGLSLITSAFLLTSQSVNAEAVNSVTTEQAAYDQDDGALNLNDSSSDNWWGWGGYGGWGYGGWGGWGGGCCGYGGWGGYGYGYGWY